MYHDDLSGGETFLQMAARWATTPYEELSSLSNIGALVWFKLAHGSDDPHVFNIWQWESDEASHDLKLRPESTEGIVLSFLSKDKKEIDSHPLIVTTMGSWSEASNNVNKELLQKDMSMGMAYATMLSNQASLLYLMGKTKDSNELLAEAVKILTPFDHAEIEPLLGTILRKVAFIHMKATQAVTAEGLYNSATSKLQSSYAKHDMRYQYEAIIARGCNGQLLSKWEKREQRGLELKKEAANALQALPTFPHNIRLSPLLSLPKPYN